MAAVGHLRQKTFNGVQVLRGVAAALVVVHHGTIQWSRSVGAYISGQPWMWPNGAAGVDVFFVISGFVMVYATDRQRTGPHPARNFLEKRFIRLMPMYWLMTAAWLVLRVLMHFWPILRSPGDQWITVTPKWFIASLLLIPHHNGVSVAPFLGVGWTLQFELFFYLLFAIALALRLSPARFLLVALPVLASLGYLVHTRSALIVLCDPLLLEFLGGILIGRLALKGVRPSMPLLSTCFIACVCGLMFLPLTFRWRALVWGLPAGLLVFAAVFSENRIAIRWPRWLLTLGDASYSLYLGHILVMDVVVAMLSALKLLHGRLGLALVCITSLLISCGLSVVVFRSIELPMTEKLRQAFGQPPGGIPSWWRYIARKSPMATRS